METYYLAPRRHLARKHSVAQKLAATALAVAVVSAAVCVTHIATAQHDYIAAPCSAWSNTAHPQLAPRTYLGAAYYTDRCLVDQYGTVSWAGGTTTTHGPHIAACALGANYRARDVRLDVCDADGKVFGPNGVQTVNY